MPNATDVAEPPTVNGDEPAATARRSGRAVRILGSGWVPAAVLAVATVLVLRAYGTPALDIAKFAGYVAYGLVIPGTLVWRALWRSPKPLLEDLAGGLATGYAIELAVYLAVRAAGVPILVAFWPVVVIVAFLAVPSLRQFWRPSGGERPPWWFGWTLAGTLGAALLGSAGMFYRSHGLSAPWSSNPYFDTLYQVALASELKNHAVPESPYLLGSALDYHWFVHAHLAASSWVTGIELGTLIYRLYALPMLAGLTVLVAITAWRISRTWWAGAVAAAMVFVVSALSPYQWSQAAFFDLSLLESNMWTSPTQTFAAVLFAAAVLVVAVRLRGESSGRGPWILAAILLAAVMGAKATFLPLLLGGLALVVLVSWLQDKMSRNPTGRWWHLPMPGRLSLVAAGMTVVFFLFASLVIFGGGSHALQIRPLQTIRFEGAMLLTGLSLGYSTHPGLSLTAIVVGLTLLAWGVRSAAMLGTRASRRDPAIQLLTGISLAGVALTLALRHPGVSQTYFLRSVGPYLGVLSACGLVALIPAARRSRGVAAAVAAAGLAGGVLAWVVTHALPKDPPKGSVRHVEFALAEPFLIIGVVIAVSAAVLAIARTRAGWLRGVTAVLIVAAITGTGLAPSADRLTGTVRTLQSAWRVVPPLAPGERDIPPGGIAAARWVRAHSAPSDVVATNTHCRRVVKGTCDNRHFWIAGFTERRVLVESWGYTRPIYDEAWSGKGAFFQLPYWDPQRLAENDGLFQSPSPSAARILARKYGVRWLVVDRRYDPPSPKLATVATLRYERGDTAIYELPR
jgi:hypothetical protein